MEPALLIAGASRRARPRAARAPPGGAGIVVCVRRPIFVVVDFKWKWMHLHELIQRSTTPSSRRCPSTGGTIATHRDRIGSPPPWCREGLGPSCRCQCPRSRPPDVVVAPSHDAGTYAGRRTPASPALPSVRGREALTTVCRQDAHRLSVPGLPVTFPAPELCPRGPRAGGSVGHLTREPVVVVHVPSSSARMPHLLPALSM